MCPSTLKVRFVPFFTSLAYRSETENSILIGVIDVSVAMIEDGDAYARRIA
jgi:hypothetical protein